MSGYIAAIDGGASSTRCVIASRDGSVAGRGTGGPIAHIQEPGGPEACRNAVRDSLNQALAAAGLKVEEIEIASCGMTGVLPPTEDVVRDALRPIKRISFVHDSITALEGALVGEPGIVVISGTGSVAYGRGPDGKTNRAGGWGYLMGDEGSGYWIGVRALSLATRSADGVIPPSPLERSVPKHLGCADLKETHFKIYSGAISRPAIASLTQVACEAAAAGDPFAVELLRNAGKALARTAIAVARALDFAQPTCSYVGGVFRCGPWILGPFADEIRSTLPGASVVPPKMNGLGGALLLGLKEAGIQIDQSLIERLRVQFPL